MMELKKSHLSTDTNTTEIVAYTHYGRNYQIKFKVRENINRNDPVEKGK